MIGAIPVDDLILLARRAHGVNCDPAKCDPELTASVFVGSLVGLLRDRFHPEVADQFAGALNVASGRKTLAGNS